MPDTLYLSGTTIASWQGVEVWQSNAGVFQNITNTWNWSTTPHQHYQVSAVVAGGSYWVPVSTNPPTGWGGSTLVTGTSPGGSRPVNPAGTEYRPNGTYFWIPTASIPHNIVPGGTTNAVVCHAPQQHPPA